MKRWPIKLSFESLLLFCYVNTFFGFNQENIMFSWFTFFVPSITCFVPYFGVLWTPIRTFAEVNKYERVVESTATDVNIQDPVVRRPVSANLGLNFNPGFFFFSSKALSRKIFSILLEYPIIKLYAKRIKLDLFFYALISEFKFRTYPRLS